MSLVNALAEAETADQALLFLSLQHLPLLRLAPSSSHSLNFSTQEHWSKLLERQKLTSASSEHEIVERHPIDDLVGTYNVLSAFQSQWLALGPDTEHNAWYPNRHTLERVYDASLRASCSNGLFSMNAARLLLHWTALDRFLWALSQETTDYSKITVPLQHKKGPVQSLLQNKKLQTYWNDGVLHWPHTIEDLVSHWRESKCKPVAEESSTFDSSGGVSGRIYGVIKRSEKLLRHEYAKIAIAQCALGIRALFLVCHTRLTAPSILMSVRELRLIARSTGAKKQAEERHLVSDNA